MDKQEFIVKVGDKKANKLIEKFSLKEKEHGFEIKDYQLYYDKYIKNMFGNIILNIIICILLIIIMSITIDYVQLMGLVMELTTMIC